MAVLTSVNAATAQTTQELPLPASERHAAAVDGVSALITKWMSERNLPGVSVAVAIDGELVWADGFGWADLEQRVPVTPLTRFRIGSASKALTSAAVGLFHERGVLDLDAPIRTYVPMFPEKRWPISTRQLMGHVSGVRHYLGAEPYSAEHFISVEAALEIFSADTLLFEPGTRSSYSSYGCDLVSAVVEQVAGRPFLYVMRDDVLAPLGMRHTVPDDVFAIVPNRARFYVRGESDGALRHERYVEQSNKWAGVDSRRPRPIWSASAPRCWIPNSSSPRPSRLCGLRCSPTRARKFRWASDDGWPSLAGVPWWRLPGLQQAGKPRSYSSPTTTSSSP